MTEFYIDIFNSAGTKLGSGPITTASDWTYTGRMSRAGSFSFTMPATDIQAAIVQKTRVARAYAVVGGVWTPVGSGIIDNIVRQPRADGTVVLRVSGGDLLRELTFRSVKDLKLYIGGLPVTHSAAVAAVAAYAPAGWTITADSAPDNDSIYGRFNSETVLAALIKIAEKTQDNFWGGIDRTVTFASSFSPAPSGVVGQGGIAGETAVITQLTETIDSYALISRVYPKGSGNGDIQLTLQATSQSAPVGFTLSKANNYIENDATTATYGLREATLEYREIGPISNTDADVQAASDMLFIAALEELRRRSTEAESAYYDLTLAGCSTLLRPLQSLRVVYRDIDAGIDIDETLNILEATWRVDASGVQTTALKVTTTDRWPQGDTQAVVDNMAQGKIYQAHPQLNANSYVTAYRGLLDHDNTTTFRFRFGDEVVQLQQVLLEFQLLPFEATTRSIGIQGIVEGSGAVTSSTPSSNASGAPSNDTSGTPSDNTSGAASGNTGAAAGNTGAASGDTGAASGNTGAASGNTGGSGELTTGAPEGGDIISAGRHNHGLGVQGGTFEADWYALYVKTGDNSIRAQGLGYNPGVLSTSSGDHTHDISTHTHDLGSHAHTLNSHAHSLNSHAHGLGSHTHDLGSHTHGLNSHTHSLSNHTHDLGDHTHGVTPIIETVYGIFREAAAMTIDALAVEYQVNGGGFAAVAGVAVDMGDGWYQLDVTADVMDATTFRPLQANNEIEIRYTSLVNATILSWVANNPVTGTAITTAAAHGLTLGDRIIISGAGLGLDGGNINGGYLVTEILSADSFRVTLDFAAYDLSPSSGGTVILDHTGMIDAQLSVRNIIQSILYL